jgi:N-acetylneuraminic acid mutarotase
MHAIITRSTMAAIARLSRSVVNSAACASMLALALLLSIAAPAPAQAQKWSSAAPIPVGAEEVYGIAAGGKLYVFGGLAPGWKPMGMVFEYDPAADRWTRKRDMPAFLHHVALATVNGRIYLFGGFELPAKGAAAWAPVNNTWEYDPAADTWRQMAPAPVARGAHNAVVVDNRIHLIGGAGLHAGSKETALHPARPHRALSTHEVFDPATNAWSTRAEMPTARNHAAAGVIDGRIFVIGGRIGSVFITTASNTDIVEEYDPATDSWGRLRAPMPNPRSAVAWGVHGGRIYVVGGEVRHRDYWATFAAVDAFDPKSNSWIRMPPMPMPRHGLAADFIGNRLHVVSGQVQSGTNTPGLVANTDRHDVLTIGGN